MNLAADPLIRQAVAELTKEFQRTFKKTPAYDWEEAPETGFRCSLHGQWSEWAPNKPLAKQSVLQRVLAEPSAASTPVEAPAAAPGGSEAPKTGRASEGCDTPSLDFLEVVCDGSGEGACPEAADLRHRFEAAPIAGGALTVDRIYRIKRSSTQWKDLETAWDTVARKLQARVEDPMFPKPTWLAKQPEGLAKDQRAAWARAKREREEVMWQLLSVSRRKEPNVWASRVFHGCSCLEAAMSICRTGFATNVQRTKGWFGEGVYTSTYAPYALRYALGMRDFWDAPGERGYVIAGQAVFAHLYPVTQADNESPLKPALKGHRIAAPEGAQGCDAHYVCVRGVPPGEDHANRTYHACAEGQRPDGDELVVGQEAQLLPEYLLEVRVADDRSLCEQVRVGAEQWGRCEPRAAGAEGHPGAAAQGAPEHKKNLKEAVQRRLGRSPTVGTAGSESGKDIVYDTTAEGGQFLSRVRIPGVPELSGIYFEGSPQPRKGAAEHSAAMAVLADLAELLQRR